MIIGTWRLLLQSAPELRSAPGGRSCARQNATYFSNNWHAFGPDPAVTTFVERCHEPNRRIDGRRMGSWRRRNQADEASQVADEVTLLKKGANETQGETSNPTELIAIEWMEKANLLKQYLDQHPSESIPEIQLAHRPIGYFTYFQIFHTIHLKRRMTMNGPCILRLRLSTVRWQSCCRCVEKI